MGVTYNPRIVTDGLVLALDAGNTKSYPGSGTTWTDLSGNGNNGTLVNGPTYNNANGGYIQIDGINDYISLVDNLGDPQQFSVSFWCYPTELNVDANNNYRRIFLTLGSSTNTTNVILIEQGGNISFRVPGGTNTNMQGSGFSGINQWGYVTCVYNQSHRQIYFNGVFKSQLAEAGVTVDFGSPQIVDPSDQIFKGNIAIFKIYNRALTASEVQQNFNATRSRFGI
jgi:hypothetical protein